jgi:glycosyltransferase involved in cell wall biosynthesis
MLGSKPLISVIVCAHNEEKYVGKCLTALRRALEGFNGEIVFVADRCTDRTVDLAKKYNVEKLVIKDKKIWENSYAESLQIGFFNSSGKYVYIIDADIVVPSNFFKRTLSLVNEKVVSVSASVRTYPSTLINKIYSAWEKTYEITPFGRSPRGAARVILRRALYEVGGFRDVPAPDTDLDIRLKKKGYVSLYCNKVYVWHIREITLKKAINGQISAGISRYILRISFVQTLMHSIFRFRPLVIYGWILGWRKYGSRKFKREL